MIATKMVVLGLTENHSKPYCFSETQRIKITTFMDARYNQYARRKFNDWRDRVQPYVDRAALDSFLIKKSGKYVPSEHFKSLGFVIEAIYDPFFRFKNGDSSILEEISAQIALRILANRVIMKSKILMLKA